MSVARNVGGYDRLARAVLAVILAAVGVWAGTAGRQLVALGAVLAAAGLVFNAVTGFCGINAALGIDTCPRDGAERTE
jgi:hypothetical protein